MFTWTFFIHGYTTGSLRVLAGDDALWLWGVWPQEGGGGGLGVTESHR